MSQPAFPFELRWSHVDPNVRPKLVKGSGGTTVDVVFVNRARGDKRAVLAFTFGGMTFSPAFDTDQTVYVHVVIVIEGQRQVDRWLAFELDRSAPLHCRVSARKPSRRRRAAT